MKCETCIHWGTSQLACLQCTYEEIPKIEIKECYRCKHYSNNPFEEPCKSCKEYCNYKAK